MTTKFEEFLIEQWRGASRLLARHLGVSDTAVYLVMKHGLKNKRTQKRYTNAFNAVFGMSYTVKDLFSFEEKSENSHL